MHTQRNESVFFFIISIIIVSINNHIWFLIHFIFEFFFFLKSSKVFLTKKKSSGAPCSALRSRERIHSCTHTRTHAHTGNTFEDDISLKEREKEKKVEVLSLKICPFFSRMHSRTRLNYLRHHNNLSLGFVFFCLVFYIYLFFIRFLSSYVVLDRSPISREVLFP